MSWFKRTTKIEKRSNTTDAGRFYAAFYDFNGSITELSAIAMNSGLQSDAGDILLEASRRLAKSNPLLIAYRNVMQIALLTGEPEPAQFSEEVPEDISKRINELWLEVHNIALERQILDRLLIDGDCLLLDNSIIPSDGFEAITSGPEYAKEVTGFKIGKSNVTRTEGLLYIGDRFLNEPRSRPWQAAALPWAATLQQIRIGAAHSFQAFSRITAVMEKTSPQRTATEGL